MNNIHRSFSAFFCVIVIIIYPSETLETETFRILEFKKKKTKNCVVNVSSENQIQRTSLNHAARLPVSPLSHGCVEQKQQLALSSNNVDQITKQYKAV